MKYEKYKTTPFLSKKTITDHIGLLNGYSQTVEQLLDKFKRNSTVDSVKDFTTKMRAAYNGKVLHILYFNQIDNTQTKTPETFKAYINDMSKGDKLFSDYNSWKENFKQVAEGSKGWAILGFDPFSNTLKNIAIENHDIGFPPAFCPILVLDMWEHAYIGDFGTNKKAYINEWFKFIDWEEIMKIVDKWISIYKDTDQIKSLTASLHYRASLMECGV